MEDLQPNIDNVNNVDTPELTDTEMTDIENTSPNEFAESSPNLESNSTDIIEYKEVDEPCVALTIIGENRLTDAEIFVKRGFKFSIKAFFSTLVLTILNMFI